MMRVLLWSLLIALLLTQMAIAAPDANRTLEAKEPTKVGDRWPGNIVYYTISWSFSWYEMIRIRRALDQIQLVSCFRFIPRTIQPDFVYIDKLKGCFSEVGRQGGNQTLSLDWGCVFEPTIIHEAMHTIGFQHEHQRPDRDDFVEILWENIREGKEENFEKLAEDAVTEGTEYDYNSIMHYPEYAFGKQYPYKWMPETTIRFKKPVPGGVQQNDRLTYRDIWRLLRLGNCPPVYWTMLELNRRVRK